MRRSTSIDVSTASVPKQSVCGTPVRYCVTLEGMIEVLSGV